MQGVKYWYLLTKTRYKGEVVRGLESRLEDDREQGIKVRVHRLRLKKCSGEIWLNSGGAKPFIYEFQTAYIIYPSAVRRLAVIRPSSVRRPSVVRPSSVR